MASPAQRFVTTGKSSQREKIVDFVPEKLKAPFLLRCAALSIDYMILLLVPIGWLIIAKLFGETGAKLAIGSTVWVLGFALFFLNFLVMPLWWGQTIGKMILGLTILNTDGTHVHLGVVLRRNLLGYTFTVLTLGLGFLLAAVNTSGRALHDFTAGTIVVRGRKTQV